jgi:hypothetical protein
VEDRIGRKSSEELVAEPPASCRETAALKQAFAGAAWLLFLDLIGPFPDLFGGPFHDDPYRSAAELSVEESLALGAALREETARPVVVRAFVDRLLQSEIEEFEHNDLIDDLESQFDDQESQFDDD